MKNWGWIVVFSILFVSCEGVYEDQSERVLVVEGWIDSGGFPIVMVTTSAPVSDTEIPLDSLDEYLLRWARVTLSDGEEEVVLTGKMDTCYMPPYIFTTGKMRGVPGKTYTLTVNYKDYYAEAKTTIPYPVSIDSFAVSPVEEDSLYQLMAYFKDDEMQDNFYKLFVGVKGKDDVLSPSFMGTINDDVLAGLSELVIYQPSRLSTADYNPFFNSEDVVTVKFSQMDEEAYQFWKKYDELQSFSGVLFFPVTNSLPSNIKGGIGYWFGYGSNIYQLDIKSLLQSKKHFWKRMR